MFQLEMKHIGSMTKVGDVKVFGLSQHVVDETRKDTIYLNFAGPATAVDAIWASILESYTVSFTDRQGRHHAIRNTSDPGPDASTPFVRYQRRIEHLAVDHVILLDRRFVEVDTDAEVTSAFVFDANNLAEKIGLQVREMVNLAVFDTWFEPLLAIGRRERLVAPVHNLAHHVYHITLDRVRWEQLIALGVEKRDLPWPENETTTDESKEGDS